MLAGRRGPTSRCRWHVAFVVDAVTVAVVDDELVVLKAVVLYQSADDEAVVHAVAVRGDHVGVGEGGVAMVAVPEDVEVVSDEAVAARFVISVVDIVCNHVVKQGVEGEPRQLVF